MSESKKIAYSIIRFLKQELNTQSPEACESIEVAIQCLENAYDIHNDDPALGSDAGAPLTKLFASQTSGFLSKEARQPTAVEKEQAEKLKIEGNNLMKADKFEEALSCYTKAIELDPFNPVYYCNRAAAHSRLNNHHATIEDCKTVLKIEPAYSKAYGRLGLAYSSLNMFKEAKASYEKALELEPGNQTYVNNLLLNEENLKKSMSRGNRPEVEGFNIGAFLENPSNIQALASQFLSDPAVENILTSILSSNNAENNQGMEYLMRSGQRLMHQIMSLHPEMIDQFRQQQLNNPSSAPPPSKCDDESKQKEE